MKSSEKRVFFRILLSYFSVLIVPAVIGIIIYLTAVSANKRLVREYSHSMLNQSIDIMDTRLQDLEALPFYLSSLPELITLSSMEEFPQGSPENYNVYHTFTRLPRFSLINSIIQDTQILLLNNQFVISESSALRMTPQTYPGLFSYTGMEYSEFVEYSSSQVFYNQFVQFANENGTVTPVILSSITSTTSQNPLALVIIQLKESSLQGIMESLLMGEGSMAVLLDQDGNLITHVKSGDVSLSLEEAMDYISQSPEPNSDYRDFIVSTIESDYNGWRYCIFSPTSVVMARMSEVNNSLILLVILTLIMGIAFSFWLSMHKAASLRKVVRYLSGEPAESAPSTRDEFSYIADAASGLVSSNRQLKQNLQAQKPLLDAAVLRNALSGAIHKPEELQYLFSCLDIKPANQKFAVMLVSAKIKDESAFPELAKYPILLSALVQECIDKNVVCPSYCLDMDSHHKAVILIGESMDEVVFRQQIELFANQSHSQALREDGIMLTFSLSDIYSLVDDLPKAYHQAIFVSQQALWKEDCILFTSMDVPEIQKLYHYPIQTELELIRLIKTGSRTELAYLLDTIRNANFVERSLSPSMTRQLTFSIRSSVLRGLADLPPEQLSNKAFSDLQNAVEFEELFACLLQLNQYLVQANNHLNSEKNEKLAAKILEYINSHYTDSSFTVYSICEEFHISESLAYQLFREVIGTSFSDLLEQIRIERACQMLSEKTWLIKDIALAVGYTSDNSFRRAFKRVMGITPGEFTSH